MKKLLTVLLITTLLLSSQGLFAQVSIKASKEEAAEQLEKLKATTTVFFYKKSRNYSIDSIKQAVTSAWDLTPIIFEDIAKADKYTGNPKYSFFSIEGIAKTSRSTSISYTNTHYYLVLRIFKEETKKGKIKTTPLCRLELFPNYATMEIATPPHYGNDVLDGEEVVSELYDRGVFYNWSSITLKAMLGALTTELKNNERRWVYANVKSPDLTEILSKDTLYIPQYLLISYNAFSGKEKQKDENILSEYKYKYRVCTDKELYQIFEVEKRGRLLFEYVKSSTDKFISIYDLKEKKVIYKRYSPMSYNIKGKDLEAID
ncbi:MAG: hypothetical protein ABIO79_16695 [Ferruginibacter sp.]